jgi:hypothetical protein
MQQYLSSCMGRFVGASIFVSTFIPLYSCLVVLDSSGVSGGLHLENRACRIHRCNVLQDVVVVRTLHTFPA